MKRDIPLKTSVSITLDEDIAEEIRTLSDCSYRSFSQYINLILRKHVEKIKKNKKNGTVSG